MESALAWIGQIAEWFGRFIPRLVVLPTTMGGVKYRGHLWGKERMTVVACGPGPHTYLPLLTEWETYPTARQTDDLRSQTITTSDDKTITVGGMVTYEVSDILLLLPCTHDPSKAVKDITLTAIHEVCAKMDWATLKSEQRRGTLETKLKNEAKRALADYGVTIIKVQLTDLAPVKVIKVIQAVSKDEE